MSLQQHALARALADTRAYRDVLCAAMDQLHEAAVREARLREQIREMREERERYARFLFTEAE